ncbi:MAG: HAD family hydrolase [Bacteroidales bacterium]|nr:HAD family hydrolase [Bacteroidales bacterium]
MATRLIIFDLDGTLLDTRLDIAQACNYALRQCGCPERRLEEYNMMVGKGISNLFRAALPEEMRNEEMVMKMKSHFIPYYGEHIDDSTRPYPGIIRMLDLMAGHGIMLAVASNKYQTGTEELVRRQLGSERFVKILGQREGKPLKPDPDIITEVMSAVPGISREEVVYCGDSDVDMQTGMNAGVRTIGVTWGFRTKEELSAYGPWHLAANAEEIAGAIIADSE